MAGVIFGLEISLVRLDLGHLHALNTVRQALGLKDRYLALIGIAPRRLGRGIRIGQVLSDDPHPRLLGTQGRGRNGHCRAARGQRKFGIRHSLRSPTHHRPGALEAIRRSPRDF